LKTLTPDLFAADPIDVLTLADLAARSIPRAELTGRYLCVAKSSDLFPLGYTVQSWVIVGVPGSEVLEYRPRFSALPRVAVASYADQVAVHQAIGARVVGPGKWFKRKAA
jgi:hypothetical protein